MQGEPNNSVLNAFKNHNASVDCYITVHPVIAAIFFLIQVFRPPSPLPEQSLCDIA